MSVTHMPVRIAICDDRDEERAAFRSMLEKYTDINHYVASIDEFSSGEELVSLEKFEYQLVILDIFMAEMNGIETAHCLRKAHPETQIIFCSTSREYAADSYDVSALYYLIKPVSEEKFFEILDLFFYVYQSYKTITYKNNRLDETTYVSDILWVESGKNHKTVIHTKKGDITTRTTVSDISAQLKDADFVSPIRFAIVNLAEVVTLPTDIMLLSDNTQVPIARDKRAEMKKQYTNYKMKSLLKKGGFNK